MTKYHINPETGKPGICRATNKCRFIDSNGETSPHFNSKAEAVLHAEQQLEVTMGTMSTTKKITSQSKPKVTTLRSLTEDENIVLTNRMIEEYESMTRGMSREERHTLGYYSMSGSSSMNRVLHNRIREGETEDSITLDRQHIHRLDSIISKFGRGEERKTLYRYLSLDKSVKVDDFIEDNFVNKDTYADTGFMSTTEDIAFIAGYARKHSRHRNFIVLEIETDKGISLQREHESIGHLQSFEKERLLPRGMSFAIDGIHKARVSVDESRETLMKQFNGSYNAGGWGGEEVVNKIPNKTFQFVKLIDEN